MELDLIREYELEGTNGEILYKGQKICHSVELPWAGNQRNISCIPEGRYELRILIHPANDAKKELLGCIAPVTELISPGKGTQSRFANEKLKALVLAAFSNKEKVFINIKSKTNEHYPTHEGAHA